MDLIPHTKVVAPIPDDRGLPGYNTTGLGVDIAYQLIHGAWCGNGEGSSGANTLLGYCDDHAGAATNAVTASDAGLRAFGGSHSFSAVVPDFPAPITTNSGQRVESITYA